MMVLVLVMMPMFTDDVNVVGDVDHFFDDGDDIDDVDFVDVVDVYAQDCPTAAARSRCQFPGKLPPSSMKVKILPKGLLTGVLKVLSCRECRLLEHRLLMSLCTDAAVSHGLRRPSVSAAIQWRPLQMDFTDHCTIARCSHILSAAMWEGGCSQTMLSTLFSYLVSQVLSGKWEPVAAARQSCQHFHRWKLLPVLWSSLQIAGYSAISKNNRACLVHGIAIPQ